MNPQKDSLFPAHAEQSVLGGLMLDNARFPDVAEVLGEQDFYHQKHRAIWAALSALDAKSEPMDILTVSDWMRGNGGGDLAYLGQVAKDTPSAANVVAYAKTVREHSIRRRLIMAATTIADDARKSADPHQVLDRAEQSVMQIAEERATGGPVVIARHLPGFIDGLERRYQQDGYVIGLSTGFSELDRLTTGLQPGDLVIVAGRPSMGKTTLAMNIAEHAAVRAEQNVAVFSLEMEADALTMRMFASLAGVSLTRIRSGDLNDEHFQRITASVGTLNRSPLYIDDQGGLSLMDLRARARRLHRRSPLSLVVVDYLQLMTGDGENQTQVVSAISRGLKALAKELGVPIIALSQLNRSVDQRANKRPVMSDLRESGAIEQDADLILFVYRDEVYNHDSPSKGLAEIIIGKQRNGPTGTVPLEFQGHYCRFRDFDGVLPDAEHSRGWDKGFDG